MTRRQRARERRAFNRARRCPALRAQLRGFRWPEAGDGLRWWSAARGTRAQRMRFIREMGDAFE